MDFDLIKHHWGFKAAFLATALTSPICQANSVTKLRDDIHFRVYANGRFDYTQTVVTRIDDDEAAQNNRMVRIWFDPNREKVDVREACIKRQNGKRWCAVKSQMKLQPGTLKMLDAEFTNFRALGISFDQLASGDELVLVTHSRMVGKPPIANQFAAMTEPGLARSPATVSMSIDLPTSMPLRDLVQGFRATRTRLAHGRQFYRWVWDGKPDPRVETNGVDSGLRRAQVRVSTFADYASIARTFDSMFETQSMPDQELSQLVEHLIAGVSAPRDRALALYRWVQDNIRYRAVYGADGRIIPKHSAAAIYTARIGDCKDHVVLLNAMLKAAGIDSSPALIALGQEFFSVPDTPTPVFDHVITYIPSLDLYLDGTFKDAAGPYLPGRLYDKPVLLTRSGVLSRTPFNQAGRETRQTSFVLQSDGSARFDYKEQVEGLRGALLRRKHNGYAKLPSGDWAEPMLAGRAWDGGGMEEPSAPEGKHDAYAYRLHARIEHFLKPGQSAFELDSSLNSGIFDLAAELDREKVRSQPFLCDPADHEETVSYILPDGFEPASLPSDVAVQAGILRYSASYQHTGQNIMATRKLVLLKPGTRICTPADFERLQPALDAIRSDLLYKVSLQPVAEATNATVGASGGT
ncbi:DUF3857 domain-containing transglutaminase family protein [Pseudoduganella violaceinigra]|uniref:DUF3857 domain-containing transglutaminase family protein n=1 Tax=Pseudoduganella violaceinigra TaxID=246602 RepID=UPI00040FC6FA|nr:DUF3857 and transglutaminase domain-containing protein [Pseudoduganella violaceinigra]